MITAASDDVERQKKSCTCQKSKKYQQSQHGHTPASAATGGQCLAEHRATTKPNLSWARAGSLPFQHTHIHNEYGPHNQPLDL